jgi:citrate synthase
MLRRIESADNIPGFLERVKGREEKLMGFGHRVYKNYDPRARIIQQHMDEVFEATEYNPLVEIARELEKRALDDDFFTSRKLYPNVDFYSGIIYEALEIPTDMFTVIFAIPHRWLGPQWMEMKDDSSRRSPAPANLHRRAGASTSWSASARGRKIVGPPGRPKRRRAAAPGDPTP